MPPFLAAKLALPLHHLKCLSATLPLVKDIDSFVKVFITLTGIPLNLVCAFVFPLLRLVLDLVHSGCLVIIME
jgi:hypothetical protein